MSTTDALRRPRCSWPSVASRRLSWATARWTAERSWVGLVGSARSSSASGREGGSFSVRSISPRSSSRRRWRSKRLIASRSSGGLSAALSAARALGLEAERAADPLDVDADHARALAAAAEGGDREPREVAHLAVVARDDRLADRLAQLVEVELARSPRRARPRRSPCASASASAARKKKRSKSSSKTRRSSCDLATVAASASRKSSRSLHGTCSSASKASRISEVPTASPSLRSCSQKAIRRGAEATGRSDSKAGVTATGRLSRSRRRGRGCPRARA